MCSIKLASYETANMDIKIKWKNFKAQKKLIVCFLYITSYFAQFSIILRVIGVKISLHNNNDYNVIWLCRSISTIRSYYYVLANNYLLTYRAAEFLLINSKTAWRNFLFSFN